MKQFRPTYAAVNLNALAENTKRIFQLLKRPDFFCPMVKANAYGHGDLAIAKKLRSIGVQHLGVGLIEEGIHLRESGDQQSILHFGLFDRSGLQEMLARQLTPVLSSLEAIEILNDEVSSASQQQVAVHLKINTGMNRLGLDPKNIARAMELLKRRPQIKLAGVATHFASGDLLIDTQSTASEQLRLFESSIREIENSGFKGFTKHIANSDACAALVSLGRTEFGVRPGISVYGVHEKSTPYKALPVTPVLELRSAIVHFQDVCQGQRVSYGGHWVANRDSRIGVIPCGYADGYARGLTGSDVLLAGKRVPIVGAICMDYFMCDLTTVPLAKVGDEVVLLGKSGSESVTASELAHRLGTIPYEILTGLSERVPRLYNDDGSHCSLV